MRGKRRGRYRTWKTIKVLVSMVGLGIAICIAAVVVVGLILKLIGLVQVLTFGS